MQSIGIPSLCLTNGGEQSALVCARLSSSFSCLSNSYSPEFHPVASATGRCTAAQQVMTQTGICISLLLVQVARKGM